MKCWIRNGDIRNTMEAMPDIVHYRSKLHAKESIVDVFHLFCDDLISLITRIVKFAEFVKYCNIWSQLLVVSFTFSWPCLLCHSSLDGSQLVTEQGVMYGPGHSRRGDSIHITAGNRTLLAAYMYQTRKKGYNDIVTDWNILYSPQDVDDINNRGIEDILSNLILTTELHIICCDCDADFGHTEIFIQKWAMASCL